MSIFVPAGPWEPDRPKLAQGRGVLRQVDNMLRISGEWCSSTSLLPFATGGLQLPVGECAIKMETLTAEGLEGIGVLITNKRVRKFTGANSVDAGVPHGITDPVSFQTAHFGRNLIIQDTAGRGIFIYDASTNAAVARPDGVPLGRALGIVDNRLLIGGITGSDHEVLFSGINEWMQFDSTANFTAGNIKYERGGRVVAISGGNEGVIMCENAIYRVIPTDSTTNFIVQDIAPDIGLLGANAWYRLGDVLFFLSESGFKAMHQVSGVRIESIGYGRVDRFVLNGDENSRPLDTNRKAEIQCYHDYDRHQIVWVYPNVDDEPDLKSSAISFNYEEETWGRFAFEEDASGPERIKSIQAIASLREAPLFADTITTSADTGVYAPRASDDPNFGPGGRKIFMFDSERRLRHLSVDRAVREFGCISTISDLGGLYGPPSPSNPGDPPSPPIPNPPIVGGNLAHINDIRAVGTLRYGGQRSPGASVQMRICLAEYLDMETGFQEGPTEFTYEVLETGNCPVQANAYQAGFGFRAFGQMRACSFSGWNVVLMDGGKGL